MSAAVLAIDRVVGRFVQPKWARLDELTGVERVLSDRCNDQEKAIIELRGQLRTLPNSEKIDGIKQDIAAVKTGQARTDERLEAIREDVHHMRQMIERAAAGGGR
jgi:ribosomal protein L29